MGKEDDYRWQRLIKQMEYDERMAKGRQEMYESDVRVAEMAAKTDVHNEWTCPKCGHLNKPERGRSKGWGVCTECGEWRPSDLKF